MPLAYKMCKVCFLASSIILASYIKYNIFMTAYVANLKILVYKPTDVLIFELSEAVLLVSFVQHCGIG